MLLSHRQVKEIFIRATDEDAQKIEDSAGIEFAMPESVIEVWNMASSCTSSSETWKAARKRVIGEVTSWISERYLEHKESTSLLVSFFDIASTSASGNNQLQLNLEQLIAAQPLLTRSQRFTIARCKVKFLFSNSELKERLLMNASFFALAGIDPYCGDSVYGALQAFEDLFEACNEKERYLVCMCFDDVVRLVREKSISENANCRSLVEKNFIRIAEHYLTTKGEAEMAILYLEKGAALINSTKLTYHKELVSFRCTGSCNAAIFANVHQSFASFSYFLEEMNKLDPAVTQSLCQKHLGSFQVNSTQHQDLNILLLKSLLLQGSLNMIHNFIERISFSIADKTILLLWHHSEKERLKGNKEACFELLKIAGSLIVRVQTIGPEGDLILRRLLESSLEIGREHELEPLLPSPGLSISDVTKFLLFKIFIRSNCRKAQRLFDEISNTQLKVECLVEATFSFSTSLFLYTLTSLELGQLQQSENILLAQTVFYAICNSERFPDLNSNQNLGMLLDYVLVVDVGKYSNLSKDSLFKIFWNLGVDALDLEMYGHAFKFFTQASDHDLDSIQARLLAFATGVAGYKRKLLLQADFQRLHELYCHLESRAQSEEMFVLYQRDYFLMNEMHSQFFDSIASVSDENLLTSLLHLAISINSPINVQLSLLFSISKCSENIELISSTAVSIIQETILFHSDEFLPHFQQFLHLELKLTHESWRSISILVGNYLITTESKLPNWEKFLKELEAHAPTISEWLRSIAKLGVIY